MTYKNKNLPTRVFDRWKRLNKDCEICFYEDSDCLSFLKKEFNSDVAELFNSMNRGAYKADLFRLCVLYKYGGVYVDVDSFPYEPIKEIVGNSDFVTAMSINPNSIFQSFIATIPENPLIMGCIDSLLKEKGNKKYWDTWNITTYNMYDALKFLLPSNALVANKTTEVSITGFSRSILVRFLEEYTDTGRWQDSLVRYNNIKLIKSRDLAFLEHDWEKLTNELLM